MVNWVPDGSSKSILTRIFFSSFFFCRFPSVRENVKKIVNLAGYVGRRKREKKKRKFKKTRRRDVMTRIPPHLSISRWSTATITNTCLGNGAHSNYVTTSRRAHQRTRRCRANRRNFNQGPSCSAYAPNSDSPFLSRKKDLRLSVSRKWKEFTDESAPLKDISRVVRDWWRRPETFWVRYDGCYNRSRIYWPSLIHLILVPLFYPFFSSGEKKNGRLSVRKLMNSGREKRKETIVWRDYEVSVLFIEVSPNSRLLFAGVAYIRYTASKEEMKTAQIMWNVFFFFFFFCWKGQGQRKCWNLTKFKGWGC